MINDILSSLKNIVEEFIEIKNIDGEVEVFPSNVELTDTKWHFYLDIDDIVITKITTSTSSASYTLRLSIVRIEEGYNNFILNVSKFLNDLIEQLMTLLMVNRIELTEFGYDIVSGYGAVSLLMKVGFE